MKRKALFIINPISGGKKKDGVPELIDQNLNKDVFDYSIIFTDGVSHAQQIAAEAAGKFDEVVAVGGDGTVNEIASAIVGSDTALGVVPFGSGNGLARFLGIPMDTAKSIATLSAYRVQTIDSGQLNGLPFFNMAGMGFDAHIAEVFSHGKKRGFLTYIKSTMQEILNYKPQKYQIEVDGKLYEREAFIISIANSSQWGNDVHISPNASVQDGLLDVCIISEFPAWRFPEIGVRLMRKTIEASRYIEIIRGKNINITRQSPGPVHLDGEPHVMGADIRINIVPGSLKVIVGEGY
ncbi:diacylglycerol/lipid kinase family protein [Mucilaginibacter sp. FT3.2]|uniref:diacylglycerol/lipid kinase family protein n=1 Tax=Mucilaginibacter sp. FT3.2 TaxID=2723090 RepID=UPI00161F519E|nr:diacylglycerol kinase family protein [Mucilaginibacter sp. FT3.2]MBB6230981.1 YegS/Rv2252/BmrU family lipid kinase [Mucilaginibacter sp. FT3.2]